MELDKYISGLLFKNECVIIPGFGGFITSYKPARIVTGERKVFPPSREIAFNPALDNNDGLLAYHISGVLKISYADALDLINLNINKWKYILSSGETLYLKEIGEIFFSEEDKIIFQPLSKINYNLDSFGFEPADLIIINRRKTSLQPEVFKKVASVQSHQRKNRNIIVYSLAAYLPVLLLLWIFLFVAEPFNDQNLSSYYIPYNGKLDKNKASESKINDRIAPDFSKSKADDGFNYNLKDILINDNSSIGIVIEHKYHIVAGSFSKYSSARKLQKNLLNRHFQSKILASIDGKYRVTYCNYEYGEEAISKLREIRKKENPSAWIIKQ